MLRLVCLLATMSAVAHAQTKPSRLQARYNEGKTAISVYRADQKKPILTQNVRADFRPYIHPIVAPDGKGVLTESSPSHHKHQTGLYWGFTRVNGRDYFHHPEGEYWRRVSTSILKAEGKSAGDSVQWQTVYDLLDAEGRAVLRESQIWSMSDNGGDYVLDLQWSGNAQADVTVAKYDYGGLFLRMPWKRGMQGRVVNSARQTNARAEGQRAVWVDVGMQLPGRNEMAHIAIFDHNRNAGFPQAWRVDGQLGVGPVRARFGDWKISKGKTAQFRHQLHVYTGQLDAKQSNDLALSERWSKYTGRRYSTSLWQLAQQEGRAAEFLTAEQQIARMTLKPGFAVKPYAAEPMITQPMAFCWDDRGRLWVAENRDYESRGRGFSNSGDSRIVILEDTDRDGIADSRKVFLKGIPFPSAIAVGFKGLWLGAPPNLLFVPDKNGDDRGDMDDIEVRLTGWGIRDRHETLNSLHWGPDGWLYGCQGFATPSRVGKPAGKGRLYRHKDPFPNKVEFAGKPVDINGGVWRYHPTKERFEVVAHGFSNPWGIDYDNKGQLFITACVIPHLWHVIPGGIYHRQGGRHFNPYVYRDIRTIADHRHRSAHGGARVYLSDAFPDKYKKRIFMANIHEHAVLTDILEPRGSGFIGRHGDDLLLANNAQWIGFSMEIGPEGAVYVLDWHDADICGKDVLNKDTGRIYRIMPTKSQAKNWPGRFADLQKQSDAELVRLQTSVSAWHARRARLILQHRAAAGQLAGGTRAAMRKIIANSKNGDHRLRALWAMHATGGLKEGDLLTTLRDSDPHLRAWAIQLACEDGPPSAALRDRFVQLARTDSSAVVRLYLASALQKLPFAARWQVAAPLVGHGEDDSDHNIPSMLWFAIEPMVAKQPEQAIRLASSSRLTLITQHIARRLTDAGQLKTVVAAIGEHARVRQPLMLGMRDSLAGRFDVSAPDNWGPVYIKLASGDSASAELARQLAQQFGDRAATAQMLNILGDRKANRNARVQAIRGLAGRKRKELRQQLLTLLDDPGLRVEAIRAMATFDDSRFAVTLLERYPKWAADEKLEVVHTLASRSSYGRQLTAAIKRGSVPRGDVPAYVARLLRRVVGNSFVDVWGPIDGLAADKEAAFAKYRGLLSDENLDKADPAKGQAIFGKTCSACHKLYGEGGAIGPDITGANRSNLEYLLGNILTPSSVIQDAYKMHVVLMDDGRVFSGIPANETRRQLRLKVANRKQPVTIVKSKIESREIAPVSMMPEGLLKNLRDDEVLDLISYLKILKKTPRR